MTQMVYMIVIDNHTILTFTKAVDAIRCLEEERASIESCGTGSVTLIALQGAIMEVA